MEKIAQIDEVIKKTDRIIIKMNVNGKKHEMTYIGYGNDVFDFIDDCCDKINFEKNKLEKSNLKNHLKILLSKTTKPWTLALYALSTFFMVAFPTGIPNSISLISAGGVCLCTVTFFVTNYLARKESIKNIKFQLDELDGQLENLNELENELQSFKDIKDNLSREQQEKRILAAKKDKREKLDASINQVRQKIEQKKDEKKQIKAEKDAILEEQKRQMFNEQTKKMKNQIRKQIYLENGNETREIRQGIGVAQNMLSVYQQELDKIEKQMEALESQYPGIQNDKSAKESNYYQHLENKYYNTLNLIKKYEQQLNNFSSEHERMGEEYSSRRR